MVGGVVSVCVPMVMSLRVCVYTFLHVEVGMSGMHDIVLRGGLSVYLSGFICFCKSEGILTIHVHVSVSYTISVYLSFHCLPVHSSPHPSARVSLSASRSGSSFSSPTFLWHLSKQDSLCESQ